MLVSHHVQAKSGGKPRKPQVKYRVTFLFIGLLIEIPKLKYYKSLIFALHQQKTIQIICQYCYLILLTGTNYALAAVDFKSIYLSRKYSKKGN